MGFACTQKPTSDVKSFVVEYLLTEKIPQVGNGVSTRAPLLAIGIDRADNDGVIENCVAVGIHIPTELNGNQIM